MTTCQQRPASAPHILNYYKIYLVFCTNFWTMTTFWGSRGWSFYSSLTVYIKLDWSFCNFNCSFKVQTSRTFKLYLIKAYSRAVAANSGPAGHFWPIKTFTVALGVFCFPWKIVKRAFIMQSNYCFVYFCPPIVIQRTFWHRFWLTWIKGWPPMA